LAGFTGCGRTCEWAAGAGVWTGWVYAVYELDGRVGWDGDDGGGGYESILLGVLPRREGSWIWAANCRERAAMGAGLTGHCIPGLQCTKAGRDIKIQFGLGNCRRREAPPYLTSRPVTRPLIMLDEYYQTKKRMDTGRYGYRYGDRYEVQPTSSHQRPLSSYGVEPHVHFHI